MSVWADRPNLSKLIHRVLRFRYKSQVRVSEEDWDAFLSEIPVCQRLKSDDIKEPNFLFQGVFVVKDKHMKRGQLRHIPRRKINLEASE